MAKTRTAHVEQQQQQQLSIAEPVSSVDALRPRPTLAQPCPRVSNELSQAEFVQKVAITHPFILPEERASSPETVPIPLPENLRDDWQTRTRAYDRDAPAASHTVLDCTHWLEVMDDRHRYGSYMRPYYEFWMSVGAPDNFFYWLDYGEGRVVDLGNTGCNCRKVISRVQLEGSCVRYCSEKEREQYRAIMKDGLLVWASENNPGRLGQYSPVDTNFGPKWIFVIDVHGNLYVNRKKKGGFHHSSFVAGQPVMAAGRISVDEGLVVCIGPNSGHYRTTWEQLLFAVDGFFGECHNVVPPFSCLAHETECIRIVPRRTCV